jgi:hypothetical protein
LCFIFSLIFPFSFMFYLLFSVSNFYFTSQYHQFPPPPPSLLLLLPSSSQHNLNSENILKKRKKIVKWYGKYGWK